MVQIPPTVAIESHVHHNAGAKYLQQLVNFGAEKGWEFYRIDTIGRPPIEGCQVVTFRRSYVPPPPMAIAHPQQAEPVLLEDFEQTMHLEEPHEEKPWWR